MAKRAKAQALPGLEDRTIDELEDAGAAYAEIRDERMKLTTREVELSKEVRRLMKKHKRKEYHSASVDIILQPPDGEEKVRVKIRKPRDTEDAEA